MVSASKKFTNWTLHNAACANVNNTSAKLSGTFRESSNSRATREATCAEAKKASQRTFEVKRKATEAHDKMSSYRERSRRVTNDHARSESAGNKRLGWLDRCVQKTAQATHRENEIRCLKQATEPAETTSRGAASECSNLRTSEPAEVLVEKQL